MTSVSRLREYRGAGEMGSPIQSPLSPGNPRTSPSICWMRSEVLAAAGRGATTPANSRQPARTSPTARIREW